MFTVPWPLAWYEEEERLGMMKKTYNMIHHYTNVYSTITLWYEEEERLGMMIESERPGSASSAIIIIIIIQAASCHQILFFR